MYQVELKWAGSWDQFQKPSCTSTPLQFTTSPSPTTTFSSWRHHHQPVEFFKNNRRWTGFLRPHCLAPLILQGLEASAALLVTLFFTHQCSSFRFFNDMNKRLQVFFRFDYGGNATKHLQCHNLLTPNLLLLFQTWCHLNEWNVSRSWLLEYVLKGGDSRWPLRGTTTKKSQ